MQDVDSALALLGGLSPRQFMRRHWQRKPLLVRGAVAGARPPLPRAELFGLAGRDDVESRLVVRSGARWTLRRGPLPRRALPPLSRPGWTLLVQGLDLHVDAARELLDAFDFLPAARLDDLMVSWASDGGGVGAHVDAYDVFLLQVAGRRRWRVSAQRDLAFVPDAPLRLLARFEPELEWLLEPGDMLYLPPRWAHEGTAVGGDCMTCSIGLRAPARRELARGVLQRAIDAEADDGGADGPLYADPGEPASATPGRIPTALAGFALDAVQRLAADRRSIERALGEALTEPKAEVWFDRGDGGGDAAADTSGVRLDRRSRMLYDDACIYLNGEAYLVRGRDARLLRRLADERRLAAADVRRLGDDAREQLRDWLDAGWLRAQALDGATAAKEKTA